MNKNTTELHFHFEVPEGYILDKENSDLDKGIIKYKKKDTLPNSWEEYYDSLSLKFQLNVSTAINHLRCFPENIRNKYIALFKLELLRNKYRQGWIPDWQDEEFKYSIIKYLDIIDEVFGASPNHFLSFQSEEIRNKFFNNFKNLIEQAEDLI